MAAHELREIYVKKCRELHEEKHPGAVLDEDKFRRLAEQHWEDSSPSDKAKFRGQNKEKFDSFRDFCKAKRPEVMAANPGISLKQAIDLLDDMWKEYMVTE